MLSCSLLFEWIRLTRGTSSCVCLPCMVSFGFDCQSFYELIIGDCVWVIWVLIVGWVFCTSFAGCCVLFIDTW